MGAVLMADSAGEEAEEDASGGDDVQSDDVAALDQHRQYGHYFQQVRWAEAVGKGGFTCVFCACRAASAQGAGGAPPGTCSYSPLFPAACGCAPLRRYHQLHSDPLPPPNPFAQAGCKEAAMAGGEEAADVGRCGGADQST